MAFYKDERLALFIDGVNFYSTAKALGLEIDFRKLLTEFRQKGRLLRAYYFTTLIENEEYSPLRPLVDWLTYNGFEVHTKAAKEYTDRDGRRRTKGDIDVELALGMVKTAPHVDHIVLFSGNGNMRAAIEEVKSQGVRVSIVSTVECQPPMVADELRREADHFIDLDALADTIARPRRRDEED